MTAKTPDEVWSQVRDRIAAMHEPFAGTGDLYHDLATQTLNLMRIAAAEGYRLATEEWAAEVERLAGEVQRRVEVPF